VPSTPLFASHCRDIVDRYALGSDIVRNETVMDVRFDYFDEVCETDRMFRIQTDKQVFYSRTAVLAVGPANQPVLPKSPGNENLDAITHALKIEEFPSKAAQAKIAAKKATNGLIVGGGFTSAQLPDLTIKEA
jgi:thioredoxin reductase